MNVNIGQDKFGKKVDENKSSSSRMACLYRISSSVKMLKDPSQSNIKEQIQKSYQDPYREERFVEKDLAPKEIERPLHNEVMNKFPFNYSTSKNSTDIYRSSPEIISKTIESPKKELENTKKTQKYTETGKRLTETGNKSLVPSKIPLYSGKKHIDNKKSDSFYDSYMMIPPLAMEEKRNKVHPFSKGQSIQKLSLILPQISDITRSYLSPLAQRSNIMLGKSRIHEDRSKSKNIKDLQLKIEDDSRSNKNLKTICRMLILDGQPIVQEAANHKFLKHTNRVPAYFHKA